MKNMVHKISHILGMNHVRCESEIENGYVATYKICKKCKSKVLLAKSKLKTSEEGEVLIHNHTYEVYSGFTNNYNTLMYCGYCKAYHYPGAYCLMKGKKM